MLKYIMRHEIDVPKNWIDVRMGTIETIINEKKFWLEENIPETDWKMWASHTGGGAMGGGVSWLVSFKDTESAMAFKLRWI